MINDYYDTVKGFGPWLFEYPLTDDFARSSENLELFSLK